MHILPDDKNDAVTRMTEITRELRTLSEDEAHGLHARDAERVHIAIARKNDLFATYEKAVEEFTARANELAEADQPLLIELHEEQTALKDISVRNQEIYDRARSAMDQENDDANH